MTIFVTNFVTKTTRDGVRQKDGKSENETLFGVETPEILENKGFLLYDETS